MTRRNTKQLRKKKRKEIEKIGQGISEYKTFSNRFSVMEKSISI